MNSIMENSQNLYTPYKSLTIDEAMIKFSGGSKIKVYMAYYKVLNIQYLIKSITAHDMSNPRCSK